MRMLVAVFLICISALATELSLDKCLDYAQKSLEIKNTELDVEVSRREKKESLYNFFDIKASAGTGPSYTMSHNMETDTITQNSKYKNNVKAGLEASFSADLYNSYQISGKNIKSSLLEKEKALLDLKENVRETYLKALIAYEAFKVKKEKVSYSNFLYNEAKLKFELGTLPHSELLATKVDYSRAALDTLSAKTSYHNLIIDLLTIIDIEDDYKKITLKEDKTGFSEVGSIDELLTKGLANRVELKLYKNYITREKLRLNSLRYTWLPGVSADAEASLSRTDYLTYKIEDKEEDIDPSFGIDYNAGLALNWDITLSEFNSIDKQKLTVKKNENRYKKEVLKVKGEIHSAYNRLMQEKEGLTSVEKHIELTKENLAVAEKMFKIGNKAMSDYIKAKNDYIEALNLRIQSKLNYKIAYYNLMKVTGI